VKEGRTRGLSILARFTSLIFVDTLRDHETQATRIGGEASGGDSASVEKNSVAGVRKYRDFSLKGQKDVRKAK